MGHAIVLGFGFCVGIALFWQCLRIVYSIHYMRTHYPSPAKPKEPDDDWLDDWRGALVVIGVLVCIAMVAALMPYQPRQKTASHGITSTGVTWKQISP
jgi:uncharacterized membrane protein